MSLWFVTGMLAAVNPCGFVLLPTYLMYFLGMQGSDQQLTQRETLRRALKVAGSLSLGFMAVFVVAASIAHFATNWLTANAKYATGFFGVALLVLGAAMLFGFKLPFMNPQGLQGKKDQTVKSMFVYGVAYAIASLGCTIGFFITAVFTTAQNGGVLTGVRNGIAYGAGMAVLVGGLTVALAFANTGLLKFLRRGLQYMDRIAAAFVLISGVYLIWYFYWVDLENPWRLDLFGNRTLEATFMDGRTRARTSTDPITGWVEGLQADISGFLNDHRWGVAVAMFSLLGATIAYVYAKRAQVLAGAVVVGVVVFGLLSSDWPAVAVIGAAVAVAGALGMWQDRRDDVTSVHDLPPAAGEGTALVAEADAPPEPVSSS